MKKVSFQKGFTLIELLIVIVIIGILAASLAPSVVGLIGKGSDAAKLSDVRNIQLAVESFYTSNGNYPASSFCIDPAGTGADLVKLNALFKGGKATAAKNSILSGCTNMYAYCKLASPNNYAIGVQMENAAVTKGFTATNTAAIGTCEAEALAASSSPTSGKYYWSVQ